MSPRLVIDNTKPTGPTVQTERQEVIAFCIGPNGFVAMRDGQAIKPAEALLALADVVRRYCDDADARTSVAISEPGALL